MQSKIHQTFPQDKYKSGIKLIACNNEQLKKYYTALLRYLSWKLRGFKFVNFKQKVIVCREKQAHW